jgi:hypothetical protein
MRDWLLARRRTDRWGMHWPVDVAVDPADLAGRRGEPSLSRSAWCYGDPGVAAALWLAGDALADAGACRMAVDAVEAVLRRPAEVRGLVAPTICHGVGGLLAICLRFARRPGGQTIRRQLPGLVGQVLARCDPALPLGVRDEPVTGNLVDDPGFLTGAAGVAMVLLAAATAAEPRWDRTLLVA